MGQPASSGTIFILILIAIVVIAALAYNFLIKDNRTNSAIALRDCQNKLFSYCTQWSIEGYSRDSTNTRNQPGTWDSFARGCSDLDVRPTVDKCTEILK